MKRVLCYLLIVAAFFTIGYVLAIHEICPDSLDFWVIVLSVVAVDTGALLIGYESGKK